MNEVPVIGVHLDLKYMMPSKSYLNRWVRRLPGWGINTLLIEYEDKFPFRKYPFLQAEGAFTDAELDEFLAAARGVGLRVIPLVQSLSHLEFALSHEQLAHLRETPAIPTQINPRNPEAAAFVNDLIDEMLAFHTADEFFHVGGDEAWHLGHNEQNRSYVRRLGKVRAWAEHEGPILRRLVSLGKRPIVWDDVFWRKPERIRDADLPRQTVLHSWDYGIRR
ncbi:MAG: family 20 glycosylhydrolase, partial [Planctomycetota bacterium]